MVTIKKVDEFIVLQRTGKPAVSVPVTDVPRLISEYIEALEESDITITDLSDLAPEVSTPIDPALLLAQRIASISAETGLKPRMIWSIIDNLRWADERAAEKAAEAEANQENPTDD